MLCAHMDMAGVGLRSCCDVPTVHAPQSAVYVPPSLFSAGVVNTYVCFSHETVAPAEREIVHFVGVARSSTIPPTLWFPSGPFIRYCPHRERRASGKVFGLMAHGRIVAIQNEAAADVSGALGNTRAQHIGKGTPARVAFSRLPHAPIAPT